MVGSKALPIVADIQDQPTILFPRTQSHGLCAGMFDDSVQGFVGDAIQRLLAIQALETARCVEEGVITDVREADVGSILGFGFAPFMGGTLILLTTLVSTILWAEPWNRLVWTVIGVTFAFGLIGFYDDYLKLVVRNPKGLVARWKYFYQSVAGLATAATLYFTASSPQKAGHAKIPKHRQHQRSADKLSMV